MSESNQPSPELFWEYVTGFQRSAAIRAAVDLDLFSVIAGGADTLASIVEKSGASERGVRILCDYMTAAGFLTKGDGRYSLTPDSAVFLDCGSPAYLGNIVAFMQHEEQRKNFLQLTETARRGTLPETDDDTLGVEHPVWIEFARSMQGLTGRGESPQSTLRSKQDGIDLFHGNGATQTTRAAEGSLDCRLGAAHQRRASVLRAAERTARQT